LESANLEPQSLPNPSLKPDATATSSFLLPSFQILVFPHCSVGGIAGRLHALGATMKQSIVHIALVVRDYDEALDFYINKLNFVLIEDTYQPEQDKRWVVIAPPGSSGTTLLIAKASKPEQLGFIGNQAGGRVFLFLNTDDFWRDYHSMVSKGIQFIREPKEADYGMVAVFEDLYGNRWDLLQMNADHPIARRIQ
jgi:predicted enzyme related to lactoylglutathione lyase